MFQHLKQAIGRLVKRDDQAGISENLGPPPLYVGHYNGSEEANVDFRPIAPAASLHLSCQTFTMLTESWLEKRYDPVVLDEARFYVRNSRVAIIEAGDFELRSSTRGKALYGQEFIFQDGVIIARCSCGLMERRPLPPNDPQSLCRHSLAGLLMQAEAVGTTQSATTEMQCCCPVTRQLLKPGMRIYQCRACLTAYSEAGWEFLQQVDNGKCCSCGAKRSVAAA